jgi:hypothetical protein
MVGDSCGFPMSSVKERSRRVVEFVDDIAFDIAMGIRYLSHLIIETDGPFLYQTITACQGRGGT